MMNSTRIVVMLDNRGEVARRLVDDLIHQFDTKQFVRAGITVGALQRLGDEIAGLSKIAAELVCDEEWALRRQEKETSNG